MTSKHENNITTKIKLAAENDLFVHWSIHREVLLEKLLNEQIQQVRP